MMLAMSNPMTARRLNSDFHGSGGPPFWNTQYWSATIWIIVITSILSFIDLFFRGALTQIGGLSISGIRQLYVWQILTYQLLHGGPFHLIFNMIWLYWIGPIAEPVLGKQRFVVLYAFSGIVGGIAFLLTQRFDLAGVLPQAVLIGASGSILGVTAAATCLAPRLPIRFLFVPVTIRLWVVFVVSVAISILAVRLHDDNAGGNAAHLGGAVAGLIAFTFRNKLSLLPTRKKSRFWKPGDPSSKFFRDVD